LLTTIIAARDVARVGGMVRPLRAARVQGAAKLILQIKKKKKKNFILNEKIVFCAQQSLNY
jgi:hypothetical protein